MEANLEVIAAFQKLGCELGGAGGGMEVAKIELIQGI